MPTAQKYTDPADVIRRLKEEHIKRKDKFLNTYPHVDKFLQNKGLALENLREHSSKLIGAGMITGTLLLSPPTDLGLPSPLEIIEQLRLPDHATVSATSLDPKKILVETIRSLLPERPRPLSRNEEKILEQVFKTTLGIPARGTLEGEHLNTTYGYIGAEQHLPRYPGDSVANHKEFLSSGITPGRGAWGYFASSPQELTKSLEETEKWYAVVQTLYLPDWNSRFKYLRDWYKYRKVLIVDTESGNAVVAAIADAGPAAWTGKHFGGSPEVMNALGGPRYKKGRVLLFFVDDPDNSVPLGPIAEIPRNAYPL